MKVTEKPLEVDDTGAGGVGNEATQDDLEYQERALQGVSRTFALTIPKLPRSLRTIVANAYLICRIIDTIEDTTVLSLAEKQRYSQEFLSLLSGEDDPEPFAAGLSRKLENGASEAERDLVQNTARVLRLTRSFPELEQAALERCVKIMADGMVKFQGLQDEGGLQDLSDLDTYCYHVAGVVGEMLTDLFCAHSPRIARSRDDLARLSVSFGQALQMTNILKDQWDDKSRQMTWIPNQILAASPNEGKMAASENAKRVTEEEIRELVGVTHNHLKAALRYVMLIPRSEKGIRRFCLCALGMAILTLRKIAKNPSFESADQVKISRRSVKCAVALAQGIAQSNLLLKTAFALSTAGLPRSRVVR